VCGALRQPLPLLLPSHLLVTLLQDGRVPLGLTTTPQQQHQKTQVHSKLQAAPSVITAPCGQQTPAACPHHCPCCCCCCCHWALPQVLHKAPPASPGHCKCQLHLVCSSNAPDMSQQAATLRW